MTELGNCPWCDANSWQLMTEAFVCAECFATFSHPDAREENIEV